MINISKISLGRIESRMPKAQQLSYCKSGENKPHDAIRQFCPCRQFTHNQRKSDLQERTNPSPRKIYVRRHKSSLQFYHEQFRTKGMHHTTDLQQGRSFWRVKNTEPSQVNSDLGFYS